MSISLSGPIPGYLPARGLHLFGGPPQVGKTPFLVQLAVALRDGAPFLGHPTERATSIGWVCLDRPWAETAPWFEKAALDVPYYALADDTGFVPDSLTALKPEARMNLLERAVRTVKVQPGGVLFVDPCPLLISPDGNSYSRVAAGMLTLHQYLQAHDLTFIGADHAGKQKGDSDDQYTRLQDRIIGSAAKQGYASTTMYLSPPDKAQSLHTFEWQPRHRAAEAFQLAQGDDGFFILPNSPMDAAHTTLPTTPGIPPAFEAILRVMPFAPSHVKKAQLRLLFADLPERSFERLLQDLVDQGFATRPRGPRSGHYQLSLKAKDLLRGES